MSKDYDKCLQCQYKAYSTPIIISEENENQLDGTLLEYKWRKLHHNRKKKPNLVEGYY